MNQPNFQNVMRVGIDATPMLVAETTGIERYATQLILALVRRFKQESGARLYLYFHTGNPHVNKRLLDRYLPRFESAHYRPYGWRRGYGLYLSAQAMFDRLDIFHFLRPSLPWFKPCQILLTIHHIGGERGLDKDANVALNRKQEKAIQIADAFIADSHYSAQDLHSLTTKSISIVHLGADHMLTTALNAGSDASHQRLGPYILYVGALQYRKNLVRLLQAYAGLKAHYNVEHVLVIAGRDGHGSEEVYEAVDQLGIQENVKLLGYVPDRELPGLYQEAAIFVYPSVFEGFGLPLLEAMRYGVPVVASKAASVPEVAGEVAHYFDPFDVEDMTKAIYEGLTNQDFRKKAQLHGPQRANQFTWENTAAKTLDVYRSLLITS